MTVRQGYVCGRCFYAEWLQAGNGLWCRAQLRTVASDSAPQYCREFRLARDLTSKPGSGMVDVPNLASRNRRLSLAPQGEEVLSIILHVMPALHSVWRVSILAGCNVRDAVRPRRLCKSRGALPLPLFLSLNLARFPWLF